MHAKSPRMTRARKTPHRSLFGAGALARLGALTPLLALLWLAVWWALQ